MSLELTSGQLEFDFESMSPRSGYTSSDTNAQVSVSLAYWRYYLSSLRKWLEKTINQTWYESFEYFAPPAFFVSTLN